MAASDLLVFIRRLADATHPVTLAPALAPTLALTLALALGAGSARAQNVNSGVSIGPSQDVAKPKTPEPTAPAVPESSVEHLFGDWGGVRTNLGRLGIDIIPDAITEFAGNVSGGTRQGSTFSSQIGLELDVDWQKAAGLTGFSTHAILVNRSGSSDSHLFGDDFLPVQEIYGSGGNVAVHLVSIYAQQTLFNRALDIAVGRMNVENDFASSPLYCNYMNNALCGDPKALPGGDIGHSAYPDAVWGGRVRVRPAPPIYVQAGVYEVNQGLYTNQDYRSGFEFNSARDSGVYLPVELGWEPKFGGDGLPGHYKIGFGYDSSSNYKDYASALPSSSRTAGSSAPTHTGNTQVWVLVDQMLRRQGKGDADGIVALAGFVHNDPNNSAYAEQYFVGLLDRGFWAARPQDTIGLLFDYNNVSANLARVQRTQQALGLPFSNNATGVQSHEMILELNYDIHVVRGVNFQPEFQYVFRPNAQRNIPDAAVFGFKAHVTF